MDEAVGGQIDVIAVDTDGVPNQMHEGLQFNPKIPEGWKDDDFPHNADPQLSWQACLNEYFDTSIEIALRIVRCKKCCLT